MEGKFARLAGTCRITGKDGGRVQGKKAETGNVFFPVINYL